MTERYPWLTFSIDIRRLSFQTWIQLGECLSKCDHIERIPLTPGVSKEMHRVYLAKGVFATTSIEGNTLSEEDVRLRIDDKLKLPPSKEYLGQEVGNILKLCDEVSKDILNTGHFDLSIDKICFFNRIILDKVPSPDCVTPGKIRHYPVVAGQYKGVDHQYIVELLDKLCIWINSNEFKFHNNNIINGIFKAIVAHLYMAWIHPFGDGNGRTARIIEFAILLHSGVPSPAAHLLSNHYNQTRSQYYNHLDLARENICSFIAYAVEGLRDGLKDQLEYIFSQVLKVSWESYIYEISRSLNHSENKRKRIRNLILELSQSNHPVKREDLIILTPRIIDLYKNKSKMTLSRDINELKRLKLIEESADGFRAKTVACTPYTRQVVSV
ncbi:MAG: Fic family protein [Candidatus Margulisiibacteriota bacterium]